VRSPIKVTLWVTAPRWVKEYESLCDRSSALGLLSEEVDPTTGAFLGNFPQAFSHVGLISSGINLSRRLHEARA